MPSFRLTLAYDGTDFAGSQVQPNQRTVQGELERVLGAIAGEPRVGTSSRGGPIVGCMRSARLPRSRFQRGASTALGLRRALNARLPADLGAIDAAPCAESFNPRFDATWREYRYWIASADG